MSPNHPSSQRIVIDQKIPELKCMITNVSSFEIISYKALVKINIVCIPKGILLPNHRIGV